MGQVAPEVNRRTQEYASVGGRNVQNPIIPPWMLPPVSGGAGGSAAGNGASANTSGSNTPVPPSTAPPMPGPPNGGMMGWDGNGRQPAQGGGRGQQVSIHPTVCLPVYPKTDGFETASLY
jgi:hypothetical protein